MKNKFQDVKAGDVLLFNNEKENSTECFLVGRISDTCSWYLTELNTGITYRTYDINEFFKLTKDDLTAIIPKEKVINKVNIQLGGKYKYPIVEQEKDNIIDEENKLKEYITEIYRTNNLLKLNHLYSRAGIVLNELMLENAKRIRNKEKK